MVALDIILIALLVFAIIRGLMKGFVMEIASLVGIVISIFVAKHFGETLIGWFVSIMGWQTEVNKMVSIVIVFLLSMLAVRFAAILISKVLKLAMLGWLDKLLGAVASFVKALLIMGVLLYSFDRVNHFVHFVSDETLGKSILYEPIKSLAHIVFPSESNENEENDKNDKNQS
ncbi:MAG: CvpA family protein [Paludibacteraceae bacterium]|nr:CvpA family protein [Paludibacteraceae bacterium]